MSEAMNITVIGRRWFEKVNGNTYHSVEVYIDGERIGRVPYAYGYGNQYEQSAQEILNQEGYEATYPLSKWARENGHTLVQSVTDVQRKKDL